MVGRAPGSEARAAGGPHATALSFPAAVTRSHAAEQCLPQILNGVLHTGYPLLNVARLAEHTSETGLNLEQGGQEICQVFRR